MTVRYSPAIDVAAVDAIDFHTHVEIDSSGHCAYDDELAHATGRYFKLGADYFARVDDLAAHYRQHNPQRWCSPSTPTRCPGISPTRSRS